MTSKYLIFILTLFQIKICFSQDYMNYEKSLVISKLMNLDFNTNDGSAKKIVDSSNVVITQFNESYCSKIEYHMSNDGDIEFCDSIFCTSTCINCFEIILNSFLSNKSRKWKKNTETDFFSLQNNGKYILYGPTKEVKYLILKLEVAKAADNSDSKFSVYHLWIPQDEFKRLKRIKTFR